MAFRGNLDHLTTIKKGTVAWNAWREKNENINPKLRGADLRKADLTGANLRKADLEGANLEGAILHQAILEEADLEEANLKHANLTRANLRGANLTYCNLAYADLRGADTDGANLEMAHIERTRIDLSKFQIDEVITEQNLAKTEQDIDAQDDTVIPIRVLVSINLPQEEILIFHHEKIVDCAITFMEAYGFELEALEEPEYGSFYLKLWFKAKKFLTSKETQEIFKEAQGSLIAAVHGKPRAQVTSEQVQAAKEMIDSLDTIPDAVVRLGELVIVKVTKDGVPKIIIETISWALQRKLEAEPFFLRDPGAVLEFLNTEKEDEEEVDEPIKKMPFKNIKPDQI